MPKRLIDLPVEAGVYTEQTARGAMGRWKDSNKARFRKGLPEKIGGWVTIAGSTFIGLARRLWDWASLDGRLWVSIGTESKLYLFQGSTLYDITPIRRNVNLTDPFTTTGGSSDVVVEDVSNGAQQGDYVRFSGATAIGGLTIDGEYRIQQILDIDNYVITDDETASSSVTGGGSVAAEYDISVGLTNTSFGVGWGTGTWSQEAWNEPRTISSTIAALRTWSLDNWGEDLLACPRLGGVYWWDRNTGPTARAVVLAGAPARANYMIISQRDRHVFTLGSTDEITGVFDPLLIRWCDQENFNDWVPSSVNTAGDLRIFRGSQFISAVRTRGEILAWTDVSVHQITYLGGSAVYGVQTVGENVSILGPNAVIEVDYRVFFMAEGDFYLYDGLLRVLKCDVRNRVYDNLNTAQKRKVFAGLNREFNEIWFFYPAKLEGVYWETDFTLGNDAENYSKVVDANSSRYNVLFDATGFTEWDINQNPIAGRTLGWIRDDGATLVPNSLEYELQAKFQKVLAASTYSMLVIGNFFDGGGDNDEGGIAAAISQNNLEILIKTALGSTWAQAAGINLGLLSPSIIPVDGQLYTITLIRDGANISINLYDETNDNFYADALSYTLSPAEILEFVGGSYGVSAYQMSTVTSQELRVFSFASSELGVLSQNQGAGDVSDEVNHYALYNYQEESWAVGTMSRTAWHDRSPVFEKPYAAGVDSQVIYRHETGKDDDGAAMISYVETYDMEVPDSGEYLMHVDKLVPDFLKIEGVVNLTLSERRYPQGSLTRTKGPFPVTRFVAKISTHIRGRQISMRVESDQVGDYWRMGTMRARIVPHGKRA